MIDEVLPLLVGGSQTCATGANQLADSAKAFPG